MSKKLLSFLLLIFSMISMACFSACSEEHVCSYTDVVTPPNCQEQGYTTHTCECGKSYVDTYVEPNGEHVFGEWEVITPVSCTQEGSEKRTCSVTGCEEVETKTVEMLPHEYLDTVYPATCSSQGYTKHVCNCGKIITDTYVAQLPHTIEGRTCTSCNKDIDAIDVATFSGTASDGSAYKIYFLKNGSYYDCYIFGSGAFSTPSGISDYRKLSKNVYIADGITSIQNQFFISFSVIESVRLPNTLKPNGCCT